MITLPDACADPRAVMIVHLDTSLAITAVERARWSNQIASFTLLERDFNPIDHRYVFEIIIVCADRCSTPDWFGFWSGVLPRRLKMFLL